ncbi:hypothetical protein ACF1BE_09415 [Streptomyces sp. NPDC014991]|uniref:hypothetical protein n=1 Tax=Streptomyces sp. NPDC014991 TaxID=3364935 RepID=UPI0036FDCB7B
MNSSVTLLPSFPDVAQLLPRQQMAMDCAVCACPLGASGRVLAEVRHRGLPFRLWVCGNGCPVARSTFLAV